ncbi:hypothetical protein VaNZ11_006642 [Volvox africanus]|uniref:VASt domain-containing protein n=1 Tax=Volvox africanus TaxID=51714 RepID=A0ABQ5S1N4_9CHLO|nr:hypothetical protein VaNZ11_006642 [Volvox africanus]
MPKQSDIRVQIPGCTAAHFWDVVYERPEATQRYHTSFNASTSTNVTPWISCQRTVNFTMPLKLPDFLKRMVGLDSVAVSEVQRVVWHGGGSFTVTSETNITNMLGAGRFTTALQFTVTESQQPTLPEIPPAASPGEGRAHGGEAAGPGGPGVDCASAMVQVIYSVRCAAGSIPWPMSATIENVMSEKALVSMQSFLDFCTQLLEEEAAVSAAAAKLGEAVGPTAAFREGDAVIIPAATGALLEPAAPVSDTGMTPAAAAGGPWGACSAGVAPLNTRTSMRLRWPSITCSQDLGNVGVAGVGVGVAGGDPFKLQRADTMGGAAGAADVFWDAPENFASVGSVSGVSSSAVSPRHLLLQSNSLRRFSGDSSATAMAVGGLSTAAASAVTVHAVATETHQVAVAVDKLATAVATLDNKIEKLLFLHEDQQQLIRHLQDLQQRQQLQQDPPPYVVNQHSESRHRGIDRNDVADARHLSDVRWMFRVAVAVLLATFLVVVYWMIHPYAGSFWPHSGSGGGSGTPIGRVPVVSVLRLNDVNPSLGGRGVDFSSGGSAVGGHGLEGRQARLTLQMMHRMEGSLRRGDARSLEHRGENLGRDPIRRSEDGVRESNHKSEPPAPLPGRG